MESNYHELETDSGGWRVCGCGLMIGLQATNIRAMGFGVFFHLFTRCSSSLLLAVRNGRMFGKNRNRSIFYWLCNYRLIHPPIFTTASISPFHFFLGKRRSKDIEKKK